MVITTTATISGTILQVAHSSTTMLKFSGQEHVGGEASDAWPAFYADKGGDGPRGHPCMFQAMVFWAPAIKQIL